MWGTSTGRVAYYYVALLLFLITTYVIWRIFHSPIGMSFRALRDSETYATSRGVDPFRFKMLLFALSAFFTGLAGGFLVHYNGSQAPTILNFSLTINLLAMIVLGGWGTFWGPILGTALLTALPEILRGPLDNWRNDGHGLVPGPDRRLCARRSVPAAVTLASRSSSAGKIRSRRVSAGSPLYKPQKCSARFSLRSKNRAL